MILIIRRNGYTTPVLCHTSAREYISYYNPALIPESSGTDDREIIL